MEQFALRLSALHTDDHCTPRDLRWRRQEGRQEAIEVQECKANAHPASRESWTTVLGLEAGHREFGSCAGCGLTGELLVDPQAFSLLWCIGCGGAGPR